MSSRHYDLTGDSGDLVRSLRDASAALGKTSKQADKTDAALERLGKEQVKAAKSAKKAGSAFSGMTLALSPQDIMAAATAVFSLGQHVADLRNDMADAAVRSGLAAETLAGLRLAAQSSGQEFSDLSKGLDGFGKRVVDASRGIGAASKAFADLGISQQDLLKGDGSIRDMDEIFKEATEAMLGLEEGALRASVGQDLFGGSGAKLRQSLGGTQGALEANIDLAREYGIVVTGEGAAGAAEWERATSELNLVLDKTSSEISDFLSISSGIRDFTTGFIFAKEVVTGTVGEMVLSLKHLAAVFAVGLLAYTQSMAETRKQYDALDAVVTKNRRSIVQIADDAHAAAEGFWQLGEQTRDSAPPVADSGEKAEKTGKQLRRLTKVLRAVVVDYDALRVTAGGAIRAITDERFSDTLDNIARAQEKARQTADELAIAEMKLFELRERGIDVSLEMDDLENARFATSTRLARELGEIRDQERTAFIEGHREAVDMALEEEFRLKDEQIALIEEVKEERASARAAIAAGAVGLANAIADALDVEADANEELTRGQKRQAMAAFVIRQAAGVAQITIDTLVAAMRAFAELGPIAGAIAAGLITGTGVASVVGVLSTPPPEFPLGSSALTAGDLMGRGQGGLTRDHGLVAAAEGEGIVTASAGVRNPGVVAAMNAGMTVGGGGVQQIVFNGRVLSEMVATVIGSPGVAQDAVRGLLGASSRRPVYR